MDQNRTAPKGKPNKCRRSSVGKQPLKKDGNAPEVTKTQKYETTHKKTSSRVRMDPWSGNFIPVRKVATVPHDIIMEHNCITFDAHSKKVLLGPPVPMKVATEEMSSQKTAPQLAPITLENMAEKNVAMTEINPQTLTEMLQMKVLLLSRKRDLNDQTAFPLLHQKAPLSGDKFAVIPFKTTELKINSNNGASHKQTPFSGENYAVIPHKEIELKRNKNSEFHQLQELDKNEPELHRVVKDKLESWPVSTSCCLFHVNVIAETQKPDEVKKDSSAPLLSENFSAQSSPPEEATDMQGRGDEERKECSTSSWEDLDTSWYEEVGITAENSTIPLQETTETKDVQEEIMQFTKVQNDTQERGRRWEGNTYLQDDLVRIEEADLPVELNLHQGMMGKQGEKDMRDNGTGVADDNLTTVRTKEAEICLTPELSILCEFRQGNLEEEVTLERNRASEVDLEAAKTFNESFHHLSLHTEPWNLAVASEEAKDHCSVEEVEQMKDVLQPASVRTNLTRMTDLLVASIPLTQQEDEILKGILELESEKTVPLVPMAPEMKQKASEFDSYTPASPVPLSPLPTFSPPVQYQLNVPQLLLCRRMLQNKDLFKVYSKLYREKAESAHKQAARMEQLEKRMEDVPRMKEEINSLQTQKNIKSKQVKKLMNKCEGLSVYRLKLEKNKYEYEFEGERLKQERTKLVMELPKLLKCREDAIVRDLLRTRDKGTQPPGESDVMTMREFYERKLTKLRLSITQVDKKLSKNIETSNKWRKDSQVICEVQAMLKATISRLLKKILRDSNRIVKLQKDYLLLMAMAEEGEECGPIARMYQKAERFEYLDRKLKDVVTSLSQSQLFRCNELRSWERVVTDGQKALLSWLVLPQDCRGSKRIESEDRSVTSSTQSTEPWNVAPLEEGHERGCKATAANGGWTVTLLSQDGNTKRKKCFSTEKFTVVEFLSEDNMEIVCSCEDTYGKSVRIVWKGEDSMERVMLV